MSKNDGKTESNASTDAIANAVERAIEKALPAAVSVAVSALRPPAPAPVAASAAHANTPAHPGQKCHECRQLLRACKGQHMKMCVYPKNEEFGQFFQGVKVNGVVYLSDFPGHEITVPKENDIAERLQAAEQQERWNRSGRKKMRKSAHLSPEGSRFNRKPVTFED